MSQYSNGYAVSIVVAGNVVDARMDGVVAVPFGADYAIRLKNSNSRSALAKVWVDGQNVTGGGIVVHGYGTVDLERPTDKAVTFRFASTESEAAEEHGKAGPDVHGDKGLIKIEWFPEREIHPYGTGYLGAYHRPASHYNSRSGGSSTLHKSGVASNAGTLEYKSLTSGTIPCSTSDSQTVVGQSSTEKTCSFAPTADSAELSSGVTVEGRQSDQRFRYVSFDADYTKPTVILLKLKGYAAEDGIPRQGTRHCPQCRTKTKKESDRYCRNCGHSLHD